MQFLEVSHSVLLHKISNEVFNCISRYDNYYNNHYYDDNHYDACYHTRYYSSYDKIKWDSLFFYVSSHSHSELDFNLIYLFTMVKEFSKNILFANLHVCFFIFNHILFRIDLRGKLAFFYHQIGYDRPAASNTTDGKVNHTKLRIWSKFWSEANSSFEVDLQEELT